MYFSFCNYYAYEIFYIFKVAHTAQNIFSVHSYYNVLSILCIYSSRSRVRKDLIFFAYFLFVHKIRSFLCTFGETKINYLE